MYPGWVFLFAPIWPTFYELGENLSGYFWTHVKICKLSSLRNILRKPRFLHYLSFARLWLSTPPNPAVKRDVFFAWTTQIPTLDRLLSVNHSALIFFISSYCFSSFPTERCVWKKLSIIIWKIFFYEFYRNSLRCAFARPALWCAQRSTLQNFLLSQLRHASEDR